MFCGDHCRLTMYFHVLNGKRVAFFLKARSVSEDVSFMEKCVLFFLIIWSSFLKFCGCAARFPSSSAIRKPNWEKKTWA